MEIETESTLDTQRIRNKITEYLVKRKNYIKKFNTWEPESHIYDPKLIEIFRLGETNFSK